MDTELIQKIFSRLDSMKPELSDLSLQIWNHPEIGYTEHFASSLLSGWLEKRGFAVQRGALEDTFGPVGDGFVGKEATQRDFEGGLAI